MPDIELVFLSAMTRVASKNVGCDLSPVCFPVMLLALARDIVSRLAMKLPSVALRVIDKESTSLDRYYFAYP